MHVVGDRVIHIDYPKMGGTIVAKMKRWSATPQQYVVLWDGPKPGVFGIPRMVSRHIETALRSTLR